jgi:hypothetical protein
LHHPRRLPDGFSRVQRDSSCGAGRKLGGGKAPQALGSRLRKPLER